MANELFFSEGQQELVWRQQQQREKGLWSSWRRSTQERVARAVADLPPIQLLSSLPRLSYILTS